MTTKTNPLLDAADYIRDNGWCRNSFFNHKGQACLAGAVGLVTGALTPMTPREIERELKTYTTDFGYSAEDAEKEIPRHKWSRSAAKMKRYVKALRALGEELDDSIAQRLSSDAHPDNFPWITDDKERKARVLQSQRNTLESLVIERNDNTEAGSPRTTKTQAIKLLRKAAERY